MSIRNLTLLLFGSIISLGVYSQEKVIITDSNRVSYVEDSSRPELDSTVTLIDGGRFCACDDATVYYDSSMSKIALQSYRSQDSCYNFNYWRNGGLKKLIIYVDDTVVNFPVWRYSELHCENGQLLFKGNTPGMGSKNHYINYYCNGKKQNEFDHVEMCPEGKMINWHENGNIKSETHFHNCDKTGIWKFYNLQGKLEKEEHYKDNNLIQDK